MSYNLEEIKDKAAYCLNCKTKPCTKGCPLGNNIPEFIRYIKEENYEKAYDVLSSTTVMQSICGRICPKEKQCEESCVRGIKQNSVTIGELEAFIGDLAIEKKYNKKNNFKTIDKKVAVIGGGPAGLTCAKFLSRERIKVTIFEKHEKLGGILRYGIPEFRLDTEILDKWLEDLLDENIDVQLKKELGLNINLERLQKEYDAIFLSFGANISCKMNIKGEDLKGVLGANELLEYKDFPDFKNRKVAVIGGGNVAIDAARTIIRLGAEDVSIIYRRNIDQMPADRKEIEDAKKDNINFLFKTNIVKIIGDEKCNVKQIECIKTELIKKEGQDRLIPINIENSNYLLDFDYVVMAIGSKTSEGLLGKLNLDISKWGYIITDDDYKTSIDGVFAGGDLIGTKATVAWASKAGREAAKSIIKYLKTYK